MDKILKKSIVKIKGIDYVRDLGGIETTDGKHIKYGLIYRTSHLSYIKDDTKDLLVNKYHISKDIDFRSSSELLDKPEQLIDGVEYVLLQVLDDNDNPAVNKETRNDVLRKNMSADGGTKGHLTEIYRKVVTNEATINHYANFFREILKSDGKPLIYHCTQGKDRTGIATIFLLLALGVDRQTIKKDYLYYNVASRRKNRLYTTGVAVAYFSPRKAKALHFLLTTHGDYVDAAFEEIDKLGGTDIYLHQYLKLSDEDISRLKDIYLE